MKEVLRRTLGRLRPIRVPDAPARAFRDLWPGDSSRGAQLLRGEFEVAGTRRPLQVMAEGGEGWNAESGPAAWRAASLGFAWLRDLRTLGTDPARLRARALAADFLERGMLEPMAQSAEVAGARISAMLGNWDFFAATAEDGLRRQLMVRLAQDGRLVLSQLPLEVDHRGALVAVKGGMAAAIALSEEAWLNRCLRMLPGEIERQFHPDGGHVERSPGQQLLALQDLIEIRNLLNGSGIEAPAMLTVAMDRAAPALRMFRHGDGALALFNGTRIESPKEGGGAVIDLVLTQAQSRGRAPTELPDAGFHRLQAGRTLVLAECGAPPPRRGKDPARGGLPRGADRYAHAGTLSFEVSVGRDRMIVNCGAAPAGDQAWRDALRSTAAHSTLILADTNSSELREDGIGRRPESVTAERHEAGGAQWLEASHDGWRQAFGVVHRRRLYLAESGDDLRGEDMVEGEDTPAFAVRFHLHPSVDVRPQDEEGTVLLRLPSGATWRLRAKGGRLAIEESIYLGHDPGPTRQVVLHAAAGTGAVQWALSRRSVGGDEDA
ncbi:heparinase II/III family protein [Roseomonas sp. NAR14]|uniref:Heparinase II/III family protein n=1 Tax=Roseomonas acroporae TaxID=2937791 RepID=A0A9X1Y3I3_9PROT|nr:heparinase II/III family protein [Roseomonas acroporae]MCK8782856.1 heparinase II/III family protein [Roseomonas acroporae]